MLRIGIVGAGIMGSNHARLASAVRGTEITAVVDPDRTRAARVASMAGAATVASEIHDIIDAIDAAVVAAPTDEHARLATELAKAGVHVLVEKPLARTVGEAEDLVAAALTAGVVLMPGHVERFNPAVLELDHVLSDVVHVAADRISPFSSRIRESVITDLMIHDLDIVRSVASSPLERVVCMARSTRSASDDLASALLQFENGMTANLTASRIGQHKIRELRFTQPDSVVTVDLIRQDVTINRVEHSEFLSDEGARYRQSGVVEIPFLEHRGEPLFLELQEFVRAVTTETPPRVGGEDGVEALRMVEAVVQASREGGPG